MSLGGISGYMQPPGISTPEDQSSIPYLPYAQQGPYQAIMSQMGNYGGSAGTGYQQGMGNVYSGGGAAGGYDPNLYSRVSSQVDAQQAAQAAQAGRGGGGYSGGGYDNMRGAFTGSGAAPYSSYGPDAGADNSVNAGWGSRDAGGGGHDWGGGGQSAGTGGAGGDASGGGDRGTRGGFAKGGHVMASMLSAPNPMGPDQGYGALKSGEFVINDKAVSKYGIDLMNAINSGKISKGKLLGLLEM